MSTTQTPDQLFNETLYNLLPDLSPEGPLEEMFANKIARFTVLSDMASTNLMRLDPTNPEQAKDYRRAAALLASYERTLKFAYTELRRLQAQRAAESPQIELAKQPRLARVSMITKPDGSLRKAPAPQTPAHHEPQSARAA